MADLSSIFDNLDFNAVVSSDDKWNECNFFYDLLSKEKNVDKFRWLLSAFLNSCYGYLEFRAAYFHYSCCDSETYDPVEDLDGLEKLRKYVRIFQQKKSGFIKTSGSSDLMKKLYKFRNRSTHDGGVEIMGSSSFGVDLMYTGIKSTPNDGRRHEQSGYHHLRARAAGTMGNRQPGVGYGNDTP